MFNYSELKSIHEVKTLECKDLNERIKYYEQKLDDKVSHIEKVENAFIDLEKNFEVKVNDVEILGDHIKVLSKELDTYKNNPCKCNQISSYHANNVSFNNEEDNKNVSSKLYKGYNSDISQREKYLQNDYNTNYNNNNNTNQNGYNNINYNNNEGEELNSKRVIDLINERKANKKAIDKKIKEKLIIEDSDYSVQMN